MDVWQNIMKRVAEMNAADADQARQDAIDSARAKRKQEELNELLLVVGVIIVVCVMVGYFVVEAISYCQKNACGA